MGCSVTKMTFTKVQAEKEMMNPGVKIKSLRLKTNRWVKYSLLLSVHLLNPRCSFID